MSPSQVKGIQWNHSKQTSGKMQGENIHSPPPPSCENCNGKKNNKGKMEMSWEGQSHCATAQIAHKRMYLSSTAVVESEYYTY